jgi:hypothetical protein
MVGRQGLEPLDPLIKSDSESLSTEVHDDVTLEDLYTWE